MQPYAYRVVVGCVVVAEDSVSPDEMLALDTGQAVGQLSGKQAKDPTFGLDAVWIAPGDDDAATGLGSLVVDPGTVLATTPNHTLATPSADTHSPATVPRLLAGPTERAQHLAA